MLRCIWIFYLLLIGCYSSERAEIEKINGAGFVSPPEPFTSDPTESLTNLNANWIAISPFAFCRQGSPDLRYDTQGQWWGERVEGVAATIRSAQMNGLKVMLKPHVWNREEGWMGNFDLEKVGDWLLWEAKYTSYILLFADLADSLNVSAFCIGNEFRIAIEKRPQFWEGLISRVRNVYDGKVTYAANWDNFAKVHFWDKLDYIGINAYFPLSENASPTVEELEKAWTDDHVKISKLQERFKKPVLFTEFGYRSIDKATGNQWELEDDFRYDPGKANLEVQANAYEALFRVFWDEPWFAGGFLWKWYCDHEGAGGTNNTDYTPQNKPAEKIIREWYGKY